MFGRGGGGGKGGTYLAGEGEVEGVGKGGVWEGMGVGEVQVEGRCGYYHFCMQ